MRKIALLFMLITNLISCHSRKVTKQKFDYEANTSAPLGYPIEVYRGGFTTKQGNFMTLYGGITTGDHSWGTATGGGWGHSFQPIPDHLDVIWLSYAEDCFYEADVDIDKEKMLSLFREGYDWLDANAKIRRDNYDEITAGFAPGGVVVVWVSGATQQVEIGRYQGKKIIIPQDEIDQLDDSDKTLFKKSYREKMFSSPGVVPIEVQKANKNKPIPFGLWDTYRKKYPWKLVFNFEDKAVLNSKSSVRLWFNNGERKEIFINKFPIKKPNNLAIPSNISFSWKAPNGLYYAGNCKLQEKAIMSAFEKIFGEKKEGGSADLVISVNQANTHFTVKLVGNGEEITIPTQDIEVYRATGYDNM